MANLPLTKSKHLLPYAAFLRAHGESVHPLLRMSHLPPDCLDNPDTLITSVCSGHFRELAAQKIDCPYISLESCRQLELKDLGDFGRALQDAPTVNASLHMFRKLAVTESSNVVIELQPRPNGDLWFGQRAIFDTGPGKWHSDLYVISWMLKIIRHAAPAWSPAEILIGSKAMHERFESVEIFESTAHLQQKNTGFIIPASMLALPMRNDPVAGDDIDAEETDFRPTALPGSYAKSLQKIIRFNANNCWLNIEQASEIAGTSVRTMQRRLSAEQKTYSNLIQEVRAEMAGALLENTDADMSEISNQLGYRNQGDFTRAFYRWAKVSPSVFLRQRSLTH